MFVDTLRDTTEAPLVRQGSRIAYARRPLRRYHPLEWGNFNHEPAPNTIYSYPTLVESIVQYKMDNRRLAQYCARELYDIIST